MEPAIVVEVDQLPFGERAVWYPEFNRVAVLRHLTPQEREEAIDELQTEWRRVLIAV